MITLDYVNLLNYGKLILHILGHDVYDYGCTVRYNVAMYTM